MIGNTRMRHYPSQAGTGSGHSNRYGSIDIVPSV
jgi:hypothetical protein